MLRPTQTSQFLWEAGLLFNVHPKERRNLLDKWFGLIMGLRGPSHCGSDKLRIGTSVLGHLLVRLLARLNQSLFHLLRPPRFARAPCCAYSFARSLRSLTSLTLKLLMFPLGTYGFYAHVFHFYLLYFQMPQIAVLRVEGILMNNNDYY